MTAEELRSRENELLARWSDRLPDARRNSLVSDGIVTAERYLDSQRKIAFLLKEVNAGKEGGWDLRDFVRDGGQGPTWNNIARWALGLQRLREDLPWNSLRTIGPETRRDVLGAIAAFNVKKTPGGGVAELKSIEDAIELGRDVVQEQVRICSPDLFVHCGVRLESIWPDEELRETGRGAYYARLKNTDTIAIGFWHPQARYPARLMHYYLMDAAREALT